MITQEKVEEIKTCKTCKSNFYIYEKDIEMLEKLSPTFSGVKYNLKIPIDCPQCRRQKRLAWRNTSKLYRRKCDYSGESILSFYNEKTFFPVYEVSIWNSDKWNPMDYGIDFDFSKGFFQQFNELNNKVPHYSRSIINLENSDFCNNANNLKSCYLCFNGGNSEDCYYIICFSDDKNCIDCYNTDLSENCYECIDCYNCNKIFFSQDCVECIDSYLLKNCINCKNCFGCKNLVNQEYSIFNKKYSKEEYKIELEKLLENNNFSQLKTKFYNFGANFPEKFIHGTSLENVSGDYIQNSKNIFQSFEIIASENLRYYGNIKNQASNLMDLDVFGWRIEKSYNSVVIGHDANNIFFCFDCWENVSNLYYCSSCVRNVSDCFGCVGLHDGKQYCILNKQYSKEEYEKLVPKIIEHMMKTGEWGEFFPASLSSYGYNETEGFFVDKMNKDEAISLGFNWSDYEAPFPKVEKIIKANMLPENISDIPDDLLNWAIECEVTKKPFRIIKQELEFYRKHNLPIPRRHPDQRHLDRMSLRNSRKLFDRKCDKCSIDMKTTYSPDRKEIVYCEKCYEKEVY